MALVAVIGARDPYHEQLQCHTWPFGFVSLDASRSEYNSIRTP